MAERRGRSWCAQIGLGLILSAAFSGSCAAGGLLDPAQFASLGTLPSRFVVSGDYVIDTNDCVLSIPTFQGVWSVQGVWSGGVAVFTFDSITIDAPIQVEGSNPVALLSHGDLNAPSILVTPGGHGPGDGGGGIDYRYGWILTGGGGGFGGAGGAGGQTTDYVPVTHPSWPPAVPGGSGGVSYGSPTGGPQVGSAGGVSFGVVGSGGAGGGGIELGAMGTIQLDGNLSADGANGTWAGGGGSGGFIGLRAPTVIVQGSLSARGGDGGGGYSIGGESGLISGGGGGGGGGRIEIQANALTLSGGYDIGGGSGGGDDDSANAGQPGGSGTFSYSALPEPPGIVLGMTAVVAGLGWSWIRRRSSRRAPAGGRLRPRG